MADKLNQADEMKLINFEVYKCQQKLFKLNKTLKFHQITGIEITHSEVMMAPIDTHWQFWKKFKKKDKK